MLLILIGILPATYALNLGMEKEKLTAMEKSALVVQTEFDSRSKGTSVQSNKASDALSDYLKPEGKLADQTWAVLASVNQSVVQTLGSRQSLTEVSPAERRALRTEIYLESATILKMDKGGSFGTEKDLSKNPLKKSMVNFAGTLDKSTKFIPFWVKVAVALRWAWGRWLDGNGLS